MEISKLHLAHLLNIVSWLCLASAVLTYGSAGKLALLFPVIAIPTAAGSLYFYNQAVKANRPMDVSAEK